MGFSEDIKNFIKKAGDNADAVTRKIILDIGTSLVEKTPVGDPKYWQSKPPKGYTGGHARANWQYSMNVRINSILEMTDKSGRVTISAIAKGIPKKAAGHVHYIQNNAPYIQRLEEGHSRQAPNGMVALTQIEFSSFVNDALAELK